MATGPGVGRAGRASFLFDTDHLTLHQRGHPRVLQRTAGQPWGAVALSVVTAEEALRGRLAPLARAQDGPTRIYRYGLLSELLQSLREFPILPFDQACEDEFQPLLPIRPRVGTQDLKIAAVALANRLVLLTRNLRDFSRIPGLVLDDWSR